MKRFVSNIEMIQVDTSWLEWFMRKDRFACSKWIEYGHRAYGHLPSNGRPELPSDIVIVRDRTKDYHN